MFNAILHYYLGKNNLKMATQNTFKILTLTSQFTDGTQECIQALGTRATLLTQLKVNSL